MFLDAWWDASFGGIIGLLLGSFLNVVIYRLPKMMERQWAAELAQMETENPAKGVSAPPPETFNLMTPRSRCPSCGHVVQWYENVPVLSYLFLRGRCSACKTRISVRYPLVEMATGALFFFCIYRWGVSPAGVAWCAFSAALVALAFIDWDTTLLPDDITLPLLWAGLLSAAMQWIDVPLYASVMGAVAGYLSLWLVYWGFKLATGKEGMGYGDFKLLAALGAWLGWKMIPVIILLSSVTGAALGITMVLLARHGMGKPMPFGPYLGIAGFIAMHWGAPLLVWYGFA